MRLIQYGIAIACLTLSCDALSSTIVHTTPPKNAPADVKLQTALINEKIYRYYRSDYVMRSTKLNAQKHHLRYYRSLIQALHTQTNTAAPTPPLSFANQYGQLAWPATGPISRHFGSAIDIKDEKFPGVIIKTNPNTPVRSIYKGKVVFANWLHGFGLLVIVNHGDGFMSLYARNKSLKAKTGDIVNTGDVIAQSGKTPDFPNPGLYFEIRQNGTPLNPQFWCVSAKNVQKM